MSIKKKVDLLISAENLSAKPLAEVVQQITDISSALQTQAAKAKKGEVSIKELTSEINRLKDAQKALRTQASMIDSFQAMNAVVAEFTKKAADAKAKVDALSASNSKSKTEMSKAIRQQESVNNSLDKYKLRLKELSDTMAKLGIDTSNFADSETKIITASNQSTQSIKALQSAIDLYDKNLKETVANEKSATEAIERKNKALRDAKLAYDQIKAQRAAERLNATQQAATVRDPAAALTQSELKLQQLMAQRLAIVQRMANAIISNNSMAASKALSELTAIDQLISAEQKLTATRQKAVNVQNQQAAAAAKSVSDFRAMANEADKFMAALRRVKTASEKAISDQFGNNIRSIIDPTRQAGISLQELERRVQQAGAVIGRALGGPVADYRKLMSDLKQSQQSLINQSDLISSFNNQVAALARSRQAYVQNRIEVKNLADQVRQATSPNAQLAESLQRAQAALTSSASAYQNNSSSLRNLRGQLRQAGVDTSNLASAQQRIQTLSSQTVSSINQLSASNSRLASTANQAAGAVNNTYRSVSMLGGERTSLSFLQRIRGELLSVTAAVVGLYGIFQQMKDSMQISRNMQSGMNLLSTMFGGDIQKARQELTYLAGAADRIGIELQPAIKQFAKFGFAAQSAGLTLKEVRYTFEQIASAGAAAGLTADEMGGLFKSFEQMLSKNQIMAEEIKGQTAERLAGAVSLAAKGMNMSITEFTKAMENGELKAVNAFVAIVRGIGEGYALAAEKARNSILAEENRTLNALNEFRSKIQLAPDDNGETVETRYLALLEELQVYFRSRDGEEFAKVLAASFRTVIDVLILFTKNADLLVGALKAFIALKLIVYCNNLVLAVGLVTGALTTANLAAMRLADTIKMIIGFALRPITLAVLVTFLGLEALQEFEKPDKQAAVATGKARLEETQQNIRPWNVANNLQTSTDTTVNAEGQRVQFNRAGEVRPVDTLTSTESRLKQLYVERETLKLRSETGALNQQEAQDLRNLNRAYEETKNRYVDQQKALGRYVESLQDLEKRIAGAEVNSPLSVDPSQKATEDPGTKGTRVSDPAVQANKAKNIGYALNNLEAANSKKESVLASEIDSAVKSYNESVDLTYAQLKDSIEKLTSPDREEKLARFTALIDNAKKIGEQRIREQFAKRGSSDPQARKDESLINQIESMRASAMNAQSKMDNDLIQALRMRKQAIDEQFADLGRKVEGTRFQKDFDEAKAKLYKAAEDKFNAERLKSEQVLSDKLLEVEVGLGKRSKDELEIRLEAVRKGYADLYAEIDQERINNPAKASSDKTRLDAAVQEAQSQEKLKYYKELAAKKEQEINDTVAARNDQIQTQQALIEAGQISQYEGQQNINKIVATNAGSIESQASATIAWAESMRGILDDGTLDALIAKMQLLQGDAMRFQEGLIVNTQNIQSFSAGLTNSISDTVGEIAKATAGAQSWGEAFKNVRKSFAQFIADFLKKIGEAILQAIIFKSIMGAMGGGGNTQLASGQLSGAGQGVSVGGSVSSSGSANALVSHSGGLVGSSVRSRSVAPSAFVGAPRYHSGGIAGMNGDEYATILQKNEEVLTKSDPRHIFNAGKSDAQTQPTVQNIKVVNAIDSGSFVSEGLATEEGRKAILNFIKANRSTIKPLL